MDDRIFLVKWKCGTFSFMFGFEHGMFDALDRIGSPSEAEVRILPLELMRGVYIDQFEDSERFEVSVEVGEMLWPECKKQVWPLEELGS